ncbi:MAG: universal stress protein [Defluviitaleaceae bacterium]|nr:universal stress protein [Defluviitaleaceae bacterium]
MLHKKVLVCITPQSNSRRLIEYGAAIAKGESAELHILHVARGNNILAADGSAQLLQRLFDYAAEVGGIVHGLCGENITTTIVKFIRDEMITNLVLGEHSEEYKASADNVTTLVSEKLPYIGIHILEREK